MKYKYADITRTIIGSAMQVHSYLGNGFQEVIYQRCLAIEMSDRKLDFAREVKIPIFYKDVDVGTRRADFLIENRILVEIKAVINMDDCHLAQVLNYLEAYNLEVGLLINFGAKSLQFKRLLNKKYNPELRPKYG